MLFNKNESRTNERILYKTKPNMLLGCKKAIYGLILLGVVLSVSPLIIKFIGNMQVYLISQIQLPLTRYTAIGFFVVILVIILYIVWQLMGWYSLEYTLTDTKIIIKSGVLSTNKKYMPYATIQDVSTSQNIFARLFNVGSVEVFSAYDNNLMKLSNISNPSKVEEIIFSNMDNFRSFQQPPRYFNHFPQENFEREYVENDGFYDEYEPITPIGHEKRNPRHNEYEYYPEDLNFEDMETQKPSYEYEPYDDNFSRPEMNLQNDYEEDNYYNEIRHDYSYEEDDYYQDNNAKNYYNEDHEEVSDNSSQNVDESSEKVIRRHFDKFKK